MKKNVFNKMFKFYLFEGLLFLQLLPLLLYERETIIYVSFAVAARLWFIFEKVVASARVHYFVCWHLLCTCCCSFSSIHIHVFSYSRPKSWGYIEMFVAFVAYLETLVTKPKKVLPRIYTLSLTRNLNEMRNGFSCY